MKTRIFHSLMVAAALCAGPAIADDQKPGDQKTLGQKTEATLEKAKDKTVEAGKAVVDETKKGVEKIKDAVTPEEGRKVDVTLREHNIEMPRNIPSGKTSFVVRNDGKERQNFKVEGQGLDKEFMIGVAPNDSKTLTIDLKPGDYKVLVPGKGTGESANEVDLRVK